MSPKRRYVVFCAITLAIKENFERSLDNKSPLALTKLARDYGKKENVTTDEITEVIDAPLSVIAYEIMARKISEPLPRPKKKKLALARAYCWQNNYCILSPGHAGECRDTVDPG